MTTTTTAPATFNEGEFAYGSWGYDQTNIDFYKVVRRTEKTIWLQPVQQKIVDAAHTLAEYVEPTDMVKMDMHRTYTERNGITFVDNTFTPAPIEKFRVRSHANGEEYISPKFGLIYPYDNRPKYQTHYH